MSITTVHFGPIQMERNNKVTKEERRVIKQAYNLLYEAGTKFPVASQEASDRRDRAAALLKRVLTGMIHTNDRAYPFGYDKDWRVWRPYRVPHHFGHYKTEVAAQKSADRINAALGIGKELK